MTESRTNDDRIPCDPTIAVRFIDDLIPYDPITGIRDMSSSQLTIRIGLASHHRTVCTGFITGKVLFDVHREDLAFSFPS